MIRDFFHNIQYFFRRKIHQIRRVIDFLPIIWKGFDFDHSYALELFKHQLERQADYMESDKAHTLSARTNASKIRTAVKLLEKVENEDYGCEYQEKLKELYGDTVMEMNFIPKGDGSDLYTMEWEFESWDNADEVREVHNKLFKESQEKQERAHKLLWDFIAHNIRQWWD